MIVPDNSKQKHQERVDHNRGYGNNWKPRIWDQGLLGVHAGERAASK